MKTRYLLILFVLGSGLALVWVLGGVSTPIAAAPVLSGVEGPRAETHIETPSASFAEGSTELADVLHVCFGECLYSSIQDAVDAANDGDVIKVAAGTYTDVHVRPRNDITTTGFVTQVVYISKTVTIRGGYTTVFADPPDPETNPTTLDAMGQGRVVYITGDISPTVEGLRITGGDAVGLGGSTRWEYDAGGGVYIVTATTTIRDNQVFSNTAYDGGGLFLQHSDATLTGNIISGNTAVGDQSGCGGLFLVSSDATLSGNTVSANIADYVCGGLCLVSSNAIASGNTITSNTAEWSGGLHVQESDATLSGNTIANNTADRNGGGLRLVHSDAARISGNTMINNTAEGGGGLNLWESAATLSGNTVTNNSAERGGGLHMEWSSDATLINNTVTDNQANSGSGLYIWGSSPRLLHNTIARNTGGDGSGVYVSSGSVVLTNTILSGHSVGISVTGRNTVTVNGVLWHNTPVTVSRHVTSFVTVQNQRTGNPAFVDPNNGDYHIGLGSAAIDAGVDAGVDHDIDGEPRPLGGGYDLGADEGGLVVTKQATPDPVQPGAPLTYTIRVTNLTDLTLHATITDTLPEHITFGRTSAGTLVLPGGVVTWTPVSIAPQEIWTETVVVTVEAGRAGPLINVVEVTTEEGATGRYVHTLAPDLEVTKQTHAGTVQPGEPLPYTITVTNTGNFYLHATVTDTLPAHVTTGETAGGTTVLPGGKLVWSPVIPAPGGLWVKTVVVTAEHGYAGPLTNLVEVKTEEGAMGEDSVTVNAGWYVYLPMVIREFS